MFDPNDLMGRFLASIEKTDTCWLWRKGISSTTGYGCLSIRSRTETAHRLAYRLFKGEIPVDKWVLHTCDVRSCVNPDHLYLGTHADNMRDVRERRRGAIGDRNGKHKSPEVLEQQRQARLARLMRPPRRPPHMRGNENPLAKLDWEKARQIRAWHREGLSGAEITRRLGCISEPVVRSVIKGRAWKE